MEKSFLDELIKAIFICNKFIEYDVFMSIFDEYDHLKFFDINQTSMIKFNEFLTASKLLN